MGKNSKVSLSCATALRAFGLAAILPASYALAEQAPTATPQTRVSEVIVTATRRTADEQKVPVSVQAIAGANITAGHITKMEDLLSNVPGAYFAKFAPVNQYISVRGSEAAGYNGAPGVAEGTSVLVDDVVTTSIADAIPDFYDLDRVEVLKGPQGTLFGRNSTGGDVAFYTKKPSFTTDAGVETSIGNYDLFEAKGYVTGPITDQLAGRLTIDSHYRGGYAPVFNATSLQDKDDGRESTFSTRGQLLFTPTSTFSLLVVADYLHEDSDGKVGYLLGNYQPSLFPPLYYGFGKTDQSIPGFTHRDIYGISAHANWNLGFANLTSITAYRNVNVADNQEEVADQLTINPITEMERDRQFSEEIRFASAGHNAIDYTFGAFFLESHKYEETDLEYSLPPGELLTVFGASTTPFASETNQDVHITSYAAFGEATWHVINGLDFTVGARETFDHMRGSSFHSLAQIYAGPPITGVYSKGWSAFTPKASLSYQFTPDIMAYALVSNGYKSGGFDSSPTSVKGLETPFNPETVWNYEGGVKSEWFSHHLRLNVTVYDMKYKNLQTQQFNPTTLLRQIINAGNLDLKGAEVEVEAVPTSWLTIGGSYAKMSGLITDLPASSGLTSSIPAQTPRDSWHLFADALFPSLVWKGNVKLHADWSWRDRVFFSYQDSEVPFVYNQTNMRGLLNLNATYVFPNQRWSFEVWGNNVTNVRYMSLGADVAAIFATLPEFTSLPAKHIWVGAANDPATYGVTFAYHF